MEVEQIGDGEPLVVLHGEPVPPASLEPIFDHYAGDYLLLAPHLYQLEGDAVEQLPALIRALTEHGAEGAPVIGHSWGVYRALQLALADDFEVERIAGIGPVANMPEDRLATYEELAAGMEAGMDPVEAALDQWFSPDWRRSHDAASLVHDWFDELGEEAILTSLRETMVGPDLHPSLEQIQIPVRLIVGAEDGATPVQWARRIHESLPNNQLDIIEDSGHFTHLEAPEQTFRILDDFLAG